MRGPQDLNYLHGNPEMGYHTYRFTENKTMRITDYENQRSLSDVGITLTKEEAEELCAYLLRLRECPSVRQVFLSEIVGNRLEREVSFAIGPHLA